MTDESTPDDATQADDLLGAADNDETDDSDEPEYDPHAVQGTEFGIDASTRALVVELDATAIHLLERLRSPGATTKELYEGWRLAQRVLTERHGVATLATEREEMARRHELHATRADREQNAKLVLRIAEMVAPLFGKLAGRASAPTDAATGEPTAIETTALETLERLRRAIRHSEVFRDTVSDQDLELALLNHVTTEALELLKRSSPGLDGERPIDRQVWEGALAATMKSYDESRKLHETTAASRRFREGALEPAPTPAAPPPDPTPESQVPTEEPAAPAVTG